MLEETPRSSPQTSADTSPEDQTTKRVTRSRAFRHTQFGQYTEGSKERFREGSGLFSELARDPLPRAPAARRFSLEFLGEAEAFL